MKLRKYQYNIECLIKEDVVEGLESDLDEKKRDRECYRRKVNDLKLSAKELKKSWKKFTMIILGIMVGLPIYLSLIIPIFDLINFGILKISYHIIKSAFLTGCCGDIMILILYGVWLISPDSVLCKIKRLKKEKEEFEKYIEEIDLEIADLVQVITKNKAELDELREQKEKNNIDRMPTEVQQISYREALEQELSYLTQLREETKADKQEETEKNSSILGRFKKKKDDLE